MIKRRETNIEKERLRMAGLCAKSEQCEFDIFNKLIRTTLSRSQIQEIIDFLTEGKFIDHKRYAGSFIRDKVKFAKWGKAKIKFQLAMKRIPKEIYLPIIDEIDEDEYLGVAVKLVSARSKTMNLDSREDKSKLYRALASRGFEVSVIKKAIEIIRSDNEVI